MQNLEVKMDIFRVLAIDGIVPWASIEEEMGYEMFWMFRKFLSSANAISAFGMPLKPIEEFLEATYGPRQTYED